MPGRLPFVTFAWCVLVLLAALPIAVSAQPTVITYQGKLTDGGGPANGTYDMRFYLYDSPTVGLGSIYNGVIRNGVVVEQGTFTVPLDFSIVPAYYPVIPFYLQIEVRPAGSASPYTILSPRHALTASPYSIQGIAATRINAPGGVTTFSVPGNYPTIGFNTDRTDYVAGEQGYGGVLQFGNQSGELVYYNTGSSTPPETVQPLVPRLTIDSAGKVRIGAPYNDAQAETLIVKNGAGAIYANSASEVGIRGDGFIHGVSGFGAKIGVFGKTNTASTGIMAGVYGSSGPNGIGVFGESTDLNGTAIKGNGGNIGVQGIVVKGRGVHGDSGSSSQFDGGVVGTTGVDGIGVIGRYDFPNGSGVGVFGVAGASPAGYGVYAKNTVATALGGGWALAAEGPRAAYLAGAVQVGGTLTKAAGSFKIDHPLDPANRYLYHSFVESPDMKNIYDGNITTDASGLAEVTLPDWFEALNRDFRYQLTVIGTFAQAIIADEIRGGRFTIATSAPNVKVSWQVTGIRQDAYANKHRIAVEEAKPSAELGSYLHPELFGQPVEAGLHWRMQPEAMRTAEIPRERSR